MCIWSCGCYHFSLTNKNKDGNMKVTSIQAGQQNDQPERKQSEEMKVDWS